MRKMNIPPQAVVDYFLGWDKIIAAKGGYAPKEKAVTKKRVRKEQARVRRSPKARPVAGTTLAQS